MGRSAGPTRKRVVKRPGSSGGCRSEGFAAGEHVPDRGGELAGDLDAGDLGAALLAATTPGSFEVMTVVLPHGQRHAEKALPAFARMVCPVIQPASSLTVMTTASAMSCGSAIRWMT